jgi:hypothetical protein
LWVVGFDSFATNALRSNDLFLNEIVPPEIGTIPAAEVGFTRLQS